MVSKLELTATSPVVINDVGVLTKWISSVGSKLLYNPHSWELFDLFFKIYKSWSCFTKTVELNLTSYKT